MLRWVALVISNNHPNVGVGTIIRGGAINIYFEETQGRGSAIGGMGGARQWSVGELYRAVRPVRSH